MLSLDYAGLWIALKSFLFPHLSTKSGCTGSFFLLWIPMASFSQSLANWANFPHPGPKCLVTKHKYTGGVAPRYPGYCYCCGKWHVLSKTYNVGEHITEYHLQCAPVHSQAASFFQETLDSGGTICLCEGSRLLSPRRSPTLWDCPRCLLHWYWRTYLKVFWV